MPVRFATNPLNHGAKKCWDDGITAHSQAALPLGSAHLACGHTPLSQDRRARQGRAWNRRAGISWVSRATTAPPDAQHSWGLCSLCYCSGALMCNQGGNNPKKVSRDLIKEKKTHTPTLQENLLFYRIWIRCSACNKFIRTFLTRLGGKVSFMSTSSSHYYLSVPCVK